MKLVILENKDNKMVLEVQGEDHTFLNILKECAWECGCDQASYIIEHPYLSQPKFIIRAKNPKKVLENAAQMIIEQTKEFENEFNRVLSKK